VEKQQKPLPEDVSVVYIASFKHWRSGKIIYAKDYGLKGFPIRKSAKKQ
jgi:hypothetical protein